MEYNVISMNVGKVQKDLYKKKEILTGIYKKPLQAKAYVSNLQINGDEQADLVNHGGVDKVICAYSYDHYPYWTKELSMDLEPGAFGENLTIAGLDEEQTCIGDIFGIGDIRIQVSQPRQPCFKVGNKLKNHQLPVLIEKTGYSGFYFRVLKEGYIEPGQRLQLLERHPEQVTVSYVNNIKYHDKYNVEALNRLTNLPELSHVWRESFQKRLHSL